MRFSIYLLLLFLILNDLHSQSSRLPLNEKAYGILDRMEVLLGENLNFHSSLKYFKRNDIAQFALKHYTDPGLSLQEKRDIEYLLKENNEWLLAFPDSLGEVNSLYFKTNKPFLKYFYKTPANFWELNKKDFYLRANPILQLKFGHALDNDDIIFQNTRGFELRGAIDNKVYFYTSLFENQQRFNDYIEDRIVKYQAIPGQGLYKEYNSSIIRDLDGWDFLNAQGYVGFNISKHVSLEFGHGKHVIGNGYHSMLLSDYGHNYFYLKFDTRIWKFHYQNIFAELSALGGRDTQGNTLIPKKYMAAHYLDFNIHPKFSLGLFEAVIFNRTNHFEFQYLNPVIIYRTVELFLDSPDNVLIGLNAKWDLAKKFQLYGQVIFDEFKLDELKEGNGWWANKYGLQIGAKYMNVLNVEHLDAQVEYNLSRPYLYAHRDTVEGSPDQSIGSYSHYNQPLAHPLGSNFKEFIFRIKYQPIPRLLLDGRFIQTSYGDDGVNENWGGNILLPLGTREMDYGNQIGQGVTTDIRILGLDLTYEIMHNYYLDFHVLLRKQDSEISDRSRETKYFGGGIRINMANQKLDY